MKEDECREAGAVSRREFLGACAMASVTAVISGCKTGLTRAGTEPVIDIHQHLGYSGRSDEALLAHQAEMGVSRTILLPAGRPMNSPSTHEGLSNGLEAKCLGNEACYQFAKAHRRGFLSGANDVPDAAGAVEEIEKYLKLGGVMIAEVKFGLDCDSAVMQRLYEVAADYRVPILMHWQYQRYNYGFERFHKMLERFPRTLFIGHAQTWWANIDRDYRDSTDLYPKGKVTAGGLTDRYLSDYANMYGDLSAESGHNALSRDEEHARGFLERHQDKLIFGSDCSDSFGAGPGCTGSQTIALVRRLAPSKKIERKLLCENARGVVRI